MRLQCPYCGVRELDEFEFRRIVEDPQPEEPGGNEAAYSELYERTNRVDSSREYWQHARGCRAWLVVHRNPSTADVLEVRFLDPALGGGT